MIGGISLKELKVMMMLALMLVLVSCGDDNVTVSENNHTAPWMNKPGQKRCFNGYLYWYSYSYRYGKDNKTITDKTKPPRRPTHYRPGPWMRPIYIFRNGARVHQTCYWH